MERVQLMKRLKKPILITSTYRMTLSADEQLAAKRLRECIQRLYDEGGTHDGMPDGIPKFLYRKLWT